MFYLSPDNILVRAISKLICYSGKVIRFPHSYGNSKLVSPKAHSSPFPGPGGGVPHPVEGLAEANLDGLCAGFVRNNNLLWHILPPFYCFVFIFINSA